MSDNRKKILEMLDAKKISVDEAMKLLQAIDGSGKAFAFAAGHKTIEPRKIKYLRVLVDNPKGDSTDSPERVNVRVPVSLIRAGMKFTQLIPREAGDKVEAELQARGISLNFKGFKDDDIDQLIESLAELEVDIDGGEGKVRVFAE
jgi:hypothetical protein